MIKMDSSHQPEYNSTHNDEHQQFIDDVAFAFQDLRNQNAEDKFARNKTFKKEFKLDEDERILYLNYKDMWFTRFKILAPTFFIIILLFISSFFLNLSLSNDIQNNIISGSIIIIVFFSIISLIFNSIAASSYRYIITDRRIIIGYTFIRRWVRSIYFTNIVDITIEQNIFARLFKTGNLIIITGSDEGAMLNLPDKDVKNILQTRGFIGIRHPFRVKKLLNRLIHHFSSSDSFIPILEHNPIQIEHDEISPQLQIGTNEVIFKRYQRKRASSFFKLLGFFTFIIFFLFQLTNDLLTIMLESPYFKEIILYSLLFLGLLIGLFYWISKYHSQAFQYIVTNQRIIFYNDFINIRCRDAIMGKITEVGLGQVLVGRIGNFGDIKIATKGYEGIGAKRGFNKIEGISNSPQEKDIIQNIVLYFQKGKFYNPLIEIFDPEFLNI